MDAKKASDKIHYLLQLETELKNSLHMGKNTYVKPAASMKHNSETWRHSIKIEWKSKLSAVISIINIMLKFEAVQAPT